ncbi:MAG TPA: aminoacyl-tRNA hydrolase [Candidatus Marinimicrobia bacterium]|jgi:PTH1 family peptidyl-tRNA hydrolase|nr:aminoacyl-tRNA hydrolase [Candidatus Neomarinimicrobiota bacterium]
MNILVGLGNPGRKYSDTKHNFGFWVLNRFAEKRSLTFQAGKGDYLLAKKGDLICIKPTSFMNNSGMPVLDVKQFFKVEPEQFLVVYDDIDLPLGTIRFRDGGGTGGHKGIESIIYQTQNEKFNRLRIGIATDDDMRPAERYVLSPFRDEQKESVNEMIEKACEGIEYYLSHDIKETMNQFNEKTKKKGVDG